jgi:hypothetical protein
MLHSINTYILNEINMLIIQKHYDIFYALAKKAAK